MADPIAWKPAEPRLHTRYSPNKMAARYRARLRLEGLGIGNRWTKQAQCLRWPLVEILREVLNQFLKEALNQFLKEALNQFLKEVLNQFLKEVLDQILKEVLD
ncbi:hypothetical protein NHX12_026006 [Muraenolepis orangiensis]|uniref:Uncharacterized protein n=1 Tax=Muraenolepis orangiensis TaxID=630683 RepID=A0A9Q0EJK0_9TELE|nr:hypothetical protein NHX12_026006 [Muraenolepis orangiensis]